MRRLMVGLLLCGSAAVAACGSDDGGSAPGTGGTNSGGSSNGGTGGGSGVGGGSGGAPAGGIIPGGRTVTWKPGVPGGIPNRTTICAKVTDAPYNAKGDGATDDAGAIQAALDACPAGQVVLVPAGKYRVTKGLAVPSGVVLRGEGPDKTSIEGDGTPEKAIIQAGSWDEADSPETAVSAGLEQGSKLLTVASAAAFKAGDFLIIDQLNDDDLVRAAGQGADPGESPCIWGSRDDGARLLGQMVEVTAVDGNSISIEPPLAMNLDPKLSPEIIRVRKQITRDVGIEDLAVADKTFRGDNNANIRFWGVAYSWIKNVDSAYVSGRHIQLTKAFRSEVRDSYVHHAHNYNPGANAYGISVDNQTSETLIENNVVYYLNAGIILGSSGPGNVIGYNFTDRMYGSAYPDAGWLMADLIANHCAHPFMALHEGNMSSQISGDNIHGSSSHQTFFRNAIDRKHMDFKHTGNLASVVFAANNRYMNLVGNVLGRSGDKSLPGAAYDQTGGNCVETVSVYRLGYPSNCANDTVVDPAVATTLFRHGNYDYVNEAVVWDPAVTTQELPASLYLAQKPAWFGAVPWPPIGPDVTGRVNDTPAKQRFDALPNK